METPLDPVVSAIRGLVTHLRANPAWPDGYSHEGWVAAEASYFFRTQLKWGVAREAPYFTGADAEKGYADLYARPSELPLHLLFEFKCISAVAESWKTTINNFATDVCTKLPGCNATRTRTLWSSEGGDAWVRYLKHLKPALDHEPFIGIGVLFIALDDERRKYLQQVRDRITKTAIPPGSIRPIFDPPLAELDSTPVVHCLAYCVDIAENSTP